MNNKSMTMSVGYFCISSFFVLFSLTFIYLRHSKFVKLFLLFFIVFCFFLIMDMLLFKRKKGHSFWEYIILNMLGNLFLFTSLSGIIIMALMEELNNEMILFIFLTFLSFTLSFVCEYMKRVRKIK